MELPVGGSPHVVGDNSFCFCPVPLDGNNIYLMCCCGCHRVTRDVYSATIGGLQYCLECMKKGAGVPEYIRAGLPVTPELMQRAKENGFLVSG